MRNMSARPSSVSRSIRGRCNLLSLDPSRSESVVQSAARATFEWNRRPAGIHRRRCGAEAIEDFCVQRAAAPRLSVRCAARSAHLRRALQQHPRRNCPNAQLCRAHFSQSARRSKNSTSKSFPRSAPPEKFPRPVIQFWEDRQHRRFSRPAHLHRLAEPAPVDHQRQHRGCRLQTSARALARHFAR